MSLAHTLFAPLELNGMLGMRTSPTTSWPWHHDSQAYKHAIHNAKREMYNQLQRLQSEQLYSQLQKRRHLYNIVHHGDVGPLWQINGDEAELSLALPAFEDGSLSARLSDDGRSLKVIGTARQEGAHLAQIELPFGPVAAEDIELVEQPDGKLSVRTSRKLPELDVTITKPLPSPAPDESLVTDAREEEEKMLNDKFKVAADTVAKQIAVTEHFKVDESQSATPKSENDGGADGTEGA